MWKNYSFGLASTDTIDSVVVRADFFASNVRGFISVRVSGDGGATYGPSHVVGGNTAEQTFLIDVTSDATWTSQKLNNANFVVNVTCFKSPTSSSNPICRLDYLPVNVTYTPFDFTMSSSPSSSNVSPGNSTLTTITATLTSGVATSVNLSVSGCPAGSSCTLSATSGNPTFSSNLTVATNATTPTGTYFINITGTGGGKTRKTNFTLTVT